MTKNLRIGLALLAMTAATIGYRTHATETASNAANCPCGAACECGPACNCIEFNTRFDQVLSQAQEYHATTFLHIEDLEGQLAEIRGDVAALQVVEEVEELAVLIPDTSRPPIDDGELEADAQPTPYQAIFKAIDILDLENTETLIDFGCGPDARVLTHAFHDTGCRGVGVELDSARADSARNLVSTAGLSPWISIVEGNATTTPVDGNVGFVYLWPETLEELRPRLQELDRFVSYAHEVPGLEMQRIDVPGYEPLWYWERQPAVEVTYTERPYAVYNGRRYYSDYNRGCNCSMCRTIRSQLASREHVERIPVEQPREEASTQAATTSVSYTVPRTTSSSSSGCSGCSNCSGGNCRRPMLLARRGR